MSLSALVDGVDEIAVAVRPWIPRLQAGLAQAAKLRSSHDPSTAIESCIVAIAALQPAADVNFERLRIKRVEYRALREREGGFDARVHASQMNRFVEEFTAPGAVQGYLEDLRTAYLQVLGEATLATKPKWISELGDRAERLLEIPPRYTCDQLDAEIGLKDWATVIGAITYGRHARFAYVESPEADYLTRRAKSGYYVCWQQYEMSTADERSAAVEQSAREAAWFSPAPSLGGITSPLAPSLREVTSPLAPSLREVDVSNFHLS